MKNLIDLFIKQPVITICIAIALLLVGILGFLKLPIRELPLINSSVITVTTLYPGASPSVMESFIATPIESIISGVEGIDYMYSENMLGESLITIRLKEDANVNAVLTEVNSRVTSINWRLPKDSFTPAVIKNLTATPAIFYGFYSKSLPTAIVCDYFDRVIGPQLEALPGVYGFLFHAYEQLAMRIWLDPKLLIAQHIAPLDIYQALSKNNIDITAGRLRAKQLEYNIGAINTNLSTPEEYNNLVIRQDNNHLIRIKDVGHAEYGPQSDRMQGLINGHPGFIVGVIPQESSDDISVTKEVKKLIHKVEAKLPPNIHSAIVWNTGQISAAAIKTVSDTAWLAVLFVLIIIFMFLGSLRAIVIPILAIPFSLIGVCSLMAALGYSVNTLTILGAVLAIGLVVDDAIVVVENTHRHLDMGHSPIQAASDSVHEILVPLIAMTLTVAIVFLPIGFLGGLVGALFHQFAFTIACTIIFSGIFAILIAPMLCSRLFKPLGKQNWLVKFIDKTMELVTNGYKHTLTAALNMRWLVLLVVAGVIALGYYLFTQTHSELVPDSNQGVILVTGIGPTSANINYTMKYGKKMSAIMEKYKEALSYDIVGGGPTFANEIYGFLITRPTQAGDRSEAEIIDDLRPKLAKLHGIQAFPTNRPPLFDITGVASPVNFVLQTTGGYEKLYRTFLKLLAAAHKNPNIIDIRWDLKLNKPQYNVDIDRNISRDLGISVEDISKSLNVLLGRPLVNFFKMNGRSYPVVPQMYNELRSSPYAMRSVELRSQSGKFVELAQLVDFKPVVSQQAMNHFQQLRSVTLTANLKSGYTLGQALTYLENATNKILSPEMKYDFSGTSREFIESQGKIIWLFISAMVAIYLMLAMQFNSFSDPFIIMTSVPLTIVGALIAVHLSHSTLNIYTEIGMVMLIGLISKHGILVVDFANHLQLEGKSIKDAVIEAASIRLRPVLMTTGAMIFGAVPLLFATGISHESLNQIGAVIIGGLSLGSMLTLFVVPTFYTFMANRQHEVMIKD